MAYTQAELDELKRKYPGVDINAIAAASGGGTATDPIYTPEQAAINLQTAKDRQASGVDQINPATGLPYGALTGGGSPTGLGPGNGNTPPHVETDENGIRWIVGADGSRVQEGDNTGGFMGFLGNLPNNLSLGLIPKGRDVAQQIVNTPPIYQTGEFKTPVPTPFGGYPVTVPPAQGTPIVNQAIDGLSGLAKGLKDAAGGGGGGPSNVPAPNLTGGGSSFYGGAQDDANFYKQLAETRSQTQAPQLQRTSIDFSGYGSGQGPAPQQTGPAPYPLTGAAAEAARTAQSVEAGRNAPVTYPSDPITSTPPQLPNAGTAAPQPSTGGPQGLSSLTDANRSMYAPPAPNQPTPGGTLSAPTGTSSSVYNPSGGVASTYSSSATIPREAIGKAPRAFVPGVGFVDDQPAGAPLQRITPGAAQPAPAESLVTGPSAAPYGGSYGAPPQPATRQPSAPGAPPPAPAPSGGGQFSNPLFAQSQQTRQAEGDVMGGILSPDMYANPERGKADASRNVQGQVLAATSNPDIYRNPAERDAAQTRQQQQGLVSLLGRDLNGGQPSLAEIQMRQGTDESIAAANALAASAGPQNANAALRQAADIGARQRQGLVGQTAALRAQEYAKAREEAGQVTATGRAQDISNQGQQYQNVTNLSQLAAAQARDIRGQDLQDLGMSYKNATDKAGLASQLAVSSRAQDLQALGMSYDNAVKQAQLEVEQNKAQLGADVTNRQINASTELGLLGMGQNATQMDIDQKMHLADLMMQKYGVDKNVALQMIGNQPIDRVFKGIAAGGAAGGLPGAVVGGLSGLAYNYLS